MSHLKCHNADTKITFNKMLDRLQNYKKSIYYDMLEDAEQINKYENILLVKEDNELVQLKRLHIKRAANNVYRVDLFKTKETLICLIWRHSRMFICGLFLSDNVILSHHQCLDHGGHKTVTQQPHTQGVPTFFIY